MRIYGQITELDRRTPIGYASVTVIDPQGRPTGAGTIADPDGFFFLDSPKAASPNLIAFSHAEFEGIALKPEPIAEDEALLIMMAPKYGDLDPVVVTSNKKNNLAWLLLLPLAAIATKKGNGSRRVSGWAGDFLKDVPPVFKGLLTVGAGFVLYKVGKKIFDNNPDAGVPGSAGNQVDDLASQGIHPTFPAAQYESWASAIVTAIWDCGTDEQTIYNIMAQLRNEADIYKLIQVYGIRRYKACVTEMPFGFLEKTLPAALTSELTSGEISRVNNILAAKGIKYRF